MMLRIFIALSASAVLVSAQAPKEDKSFRTSPAGYTDTPVLPGQTWKVHDIARPHPAVVTPAPTNDPLKPPSDALVLFDGSNLSQWSTPGRGADKGKMVPAGWKVENGYVEIVPGAGDLVSNEKFGDAQYHIEWSESVKPYGTSQWRGNSGVIIMSLYEIQVLDSYQDLTYADGQAGAIYGQWPPLVNPIRKPGDWNVYDIIWEAPKFEGDKLVKPAYVTVIFNGVVVHHHKEVIGRMTHRQVATYAPHASELPLSLQDHDVPVRYRNIWVRKLKGYDTN
jgi:hypothetical protein